MSAEDVRQGAPLSRSAGRLLPRRAQAALEYLAGVTGELTRVVDTNWDPPVTASARLVSIFRRSTPSISGRRLCHPGHPPDRQGDRWWPGGGPAVAAAARLGPSATVPRRSTTGSSRSRGSFRPPGCCCSPTRTAVVILAAAVAARCTAEVAGGAAGGGDPGAGRWWRGGLFRLPKGDALAHRRTATLMVVVLGMVILVGARVWLVLAAAGWAVLGCSARPSPTILPPTPSASTAGHRASGVHRGRGVRNQAGPTTPGSPAMRHVMGKFD